MFLLDKYLTKRLQSRNLPEERQMVATSRFVSEEIIQAYERDGAVRLKGVFSDWVNSIKEGIEHNMREPGPYGSENVVEGETGRFFDDYCNWQRLPAIRDVVMNSPAGEIAAAITLSDTAQFFHDHILVKEPGTSKPTPWHQDMPYYFVDGKQSVSIWIPVDPVHENTLRFIAGSHKWEKLVIPKHWAIESDFYTGEQEYLPVPDPDASPQDFKVLEWAMEPGDAVLFDYRTVHGARANMSKLRRRAFSMRWLGDDMRYIERPGRTSPPFPGHDMKQGQKLREDWFPILYRSDAS